MGISYNPLWKLLIDRGIKKSQLREMVGMGTTTLAQMGKNERVSLKIIESICAALNCKIEDVVEYIPNQQKAGE